MNNKHKIITIKTNHHLYHHNDDHETSSVSTTDSEKEDLKKFEEQTKIIMGALKDGDIKAIKSLLKNKEYEYLFYYSIDDLPVGRTTIVETLIANGKYNQIRLLVKCGIDLNEDVTDNDETLSEVIKENPSIIYEQALIVQKPELISIFFPEITFDDSLTLKQKQEQLYMETERRLKEPKQLQEHPQPQSKKRRVESIEEEMQEQQKKQMILINFNWYIKIYLST